MNNKELLNKYTALCMQLQEEYLKEKQDFVKQKQLEVEYKELRNKILYIMKTNS